jgi:hypothetical protein
MVLLSALLMWRMVTMVMRITGALRVRRSQWGRRSRR